MDKRTLAPKIVIPEGARAVYVGTLVYRHDANRVTRVDVRDDCSQAMADLAKWKVTGVRGRDVVKRLEQVVR